MFYLENGFADMQEIINIDVPMIFCIGGRGTGKTYGTLDYLLKTNTKFIYMRRTQSQADMINRPEFSPFKSLMIEDENLHIGTGSISKYNSAFYKQKKDDDGVYKNQGLPIGYTCALSTVSNLRGFDASDVTLLCYDEFIPEKHERPLKNEGDALLNCYETINRNREITRGQKPLKMLCLSNANDLASPVFETLGLIDVVDKMVRKKQEVKIDYDRGYAIIMLQDSPISQAKSQTALYKMTRGTEFADMALNNAFSREDYTNVKSRPIQEYRSLWVYDDICIYKHKSKREFYCTRTISGSPELFPATASGQKYFKDKHGQFYFDMLSGKVFYSDYYSKIKMLKLFQV